MRVERRAVALADVPELAAAGWRVLYALAAPMRGHDVLLERVWHEHVEGTCVEVPRRLALYAQAIGSTPEAVLEGWVEKHTAPAEAYERAVRP